MSAIKLGAGGYGINSSIEDAFCLGWRIALLKENSTKNDLITSFNNERRQNALLIGEDSLKKRNYTLYENLIQKRAKKASETIDIQKEDQIYKEKIKKPNFDLEIGRLETYIPVQLLNQIKNSQINLWEALNRDLNFNIILAFVDDSIKRDIVSFIEKINIISNIRFNVIFIEKEFSEERDYLQFEDPSENLKAFFDANDGLIFIIRPDNFLEKLIIIPKELQQWQNVFCNYFLNDLAFKIDCLNIN